MLTLIVLGLFGLVQITIYWLCIGKRWKYVDFAMLAFAIFCNTWLLPRILMNREHHCEGCAMSYNGITLALCLLLGNTITVLIFVVYALVRRRQEKRRTK